MTNNEFGLILDMDGVMVDSDIYRLPSYNMALKKAGHEFQISQEELDLYPNNPVGLIKYLEGQHTCSIDIGILAGYVHKFEMELMKGLHTEVMPKIEQNGDLDTLLDELDHQQISYGIATSSRKERALQILEMLGYATGEKVDDRFKAFLAREDVGSIKPNPAVYKEIIKRMDGPDFYFAIEDSAHGIKAAKDAGLYVIGYNPNKLADDTFKDADFVIESFSELSYQKLKKLKKEVN